MECSVGEADVFLDLSADPQELTAERNQIYEAFKHLNVAEALAPHAPTKPRIGLECVAHVVDAILDSANVSKPDLVFAETSLMPERVRLGDALRDFVFVTARGTDTVELRDRILKAEGAYNCVYPALHDTQNTVYYLRGFLLDAQRMKIYWSRYPAAEGARGVLPEVPDQLANALATVAAKKEPSWSPCECQGNPVTAMSAFGAQELPALSLQAAERRHEFAISDPEQREKRVALFHSVFHKTGLKDYGCSYLLCLPLLGGLDDTTKAGRLGPIGALFVVIAYHEGGVVFADQLMCKLGRCLAYLMKDALAPFLFSAARSMVTTALKSTERAARASVMSRNMSHNIGSHALAGVSEADITERPRDADVLLRYMQERMDFLARVSTDWPSYRQPQLFLRDLLGGWCRQGLLLDRLVQDDLFNGEDIELKVQLPDRSLVEYAYLDDPEDSSAGTRRRKGLFKKSQNGNDGGAATQQDVMVAIPGGVVGRQAFYSFLEDAIRNAAKHNRRQRKDQKLTVLLELREPDNEGLRSRAYLVKYRDNLSPGGKLCEDIKEKIKVPLVDPATGEMTDHDWGIQEMEVCADYLAAPFTSGNAELFAQVEPNGGGRFRLWCGEGEDPDGNGQVLEYRFLLQKPTLAVVSGPDGLPEVKDGDALGLRLRPCNLLDRQGLNELAQDLYGWSAGLLYLVCQPASLEGLLEWIKANEKFLPARIMVRTRDDGLQASPGDLIRTNELAGRVYADTAASEPWTDGQTAEQLLVELYWRYLCAFAARHDAQPPFHVVLYFDREGDAGLRLAHRWAALRQDLDGYPVTPGLGAAEGRAPEQGSRKAPCLGELILAYPLYAGEGSGDQQPNPWKAMPLGSVGVATWEAADGSWFFFDNHGDGKAESALSQGPARRVFSQYIGSYSNTGDSMPNNRDGFDLMSNPPSKLPGALFLVGVIEAALLRVLVLDERLAGKIFRLNEGRLKPKGPSGLEPAYRKANITIGAGWGCAEGYKPAVDAKAGVKCEPEGAVWLVTGDQADVVSVAEVENGSPRVAWSKAKDLDPLFDVAVIHRGLAEALADQPQSRFSSERVVKGLRQVAGRVVVTSGRGAQRSGDLMRWPFVEFAALQGYCGREISKVSLASVLLSATGEVEVDHRTPDE